MATRGRIFGYMLGRLKYLAIRTYDRIIYITIYMRNKSTSAGNQQGSPIKLDPSETIRRIPQRRELILLLAILFTDGCVSPKGVRSWRIFFANKSKTLIDLFRDCIITTFSYGPERVRLGYTSDGLFKAVVDSKEIGEYLVNRFGTFRTLKFQNGKNTKAKLPLIFLERSPFLAEFLRVAFSCDGGLSFYPARRNGKRGGTKWLIRTIFLSCVHPKLRSDYMYLLKKLGVNAREVPNDGKIKIEREKEIKKFYDLIGFVRGVKVTGNSKYWSGQEKQKVLEIMTASYNNPSKIYNLEKFSLR